VAAPIGTIARFSVGLNPGSGPRWLVSGPDGNLWFTDIGKTRAIGRITPGGAITEFTAGLSIFGKADPDGQDERQTPQAATQEYDHRHRRVLHRAGQDGDR
jgi:hypothetical protein